MPCSISGTDGEGDHRGEGWYPIPLDQCLNHPPFGEDALYLPFLGKSIGKLRALTGVCMPTLETLHLSLSGRTSAALGGPRCWGSRAGGDSGPGHLKPPLSSAPLLCPAISFDKGEKLGHYHYTHPTEGKMEEGNKWQSQTQNSDLLVLSPVLSPAHLASQVVEGERASL